jgi:ABC-type dipeptide/oligopeptide/nickel transport system permease component
MGRYFLRRLLELLPTLLMISLLVFLMVRLIPGDVALLIAGENAQPEVVERIRVNLGLDRPVYQQYFIYLAHLLQGDLGRSIRSGQPISQELATRLPATLALALAACIIFTIVGTILGLVGGLWHHRWPDHLVRILSLVGVSMPSFWLGVLLMLVFAVQLRWLPVAGTGGVKNLILPAVTASLGGIALLSRLLRTSLVEVMGEDYIRTARAKGLKERLIINRHALRNSLIPAVTVLGLEFARLLAGVVVVENVFAWPGLGRLLVTAIDTRDYPMVQAAILTFSVMLVSVNIAVDLLVGFLDPRIRYH